MQERNYKFEFKICDKNFDNKLTLTAQNLLHQLMKTENYTNVKFVIIAFLKRTRSMKRKRFKKKSLSYLCYTAFALDIAVFKDHG